MGNNDLLIRSNWSSPDQQKASERQSKVQKVISTLRRKKTSAFVPELKPYDDLKQRLSRSKWLRVLSSKPPPKYQPLLTLLAEYEAITQGIQDRNPKRSTCERAFALNTKVAVAFGDLARIHEKEWLPTGRRNIKFEQDKRLFHTLKAMEKIIQDVGYLYQSERVHDNGSEEEIGWTKFVDECAGDSESIDEEQIQGSCDTKISDEETTPLLLGDVASTGVQICQRSVYLPEKRARPPPYLELENGLQNDVYINQDQASIQVGESEELSRATATRFQPCYLLMLLFGSFIALSCCLGVFFTMKKEYSMGDAFTLAGYIIAIGGLISTGALAYHYPRCNCWKEEGNKEQDVVELNILRW